MQSKEDSKKITWEEQNVVSVFVKGVSIKAESGLKENDSDGSASPDQSQSQKREDSSSE
tara:strand:+ start:3609 stop:3785 length:177 start_codon:yes stop_codon:yes gene_type:complete